MNSLANFVASSPEGRPLVQEQITPLSTPDQIASRLLLGIELIVDGIANTENSYCRCGHYPQIENLYKETYRSIQGHSSLRVEMKQAVKLLGSKLKNRLNEMRKEIMDELKETTHPAIVADIEVLENQLKEVKALLDENPKLLEDSIETEEHSIPVKRGFPLFGRRNRLPDKKVVVTKKAVKSHIFTRYCEYQNAIRTQTLKLHTSVENQIQAAMNDGHPNAWNWNSQVTLFSRRCMYLESSLKKLRECSFMNL